MFADPLNHAPQAVRLYARLALSEIVLTRYDVRVSVHFKSNWIKFYQHFLVLVRGAHFVQKLEFLGYLPKLLPHDDLVNRLWLQYFLKAGLTAEKRKADVDWQDFDSGCTKGGFNRVLHLLIFNRILTGI